MGLPSPVTLLMGLLVFQGVPRPLSGGLGRYRGSGACRARPGAEALEGPDAVSSGSSGVTPEAGREHRLRLYYLLHVSFLPA